MALNPTDIDVTSQFIITHMTEEQLKELESSETGLPENAIITTSDADENISCLRTEVVYDMTSSDSSINWGYTSGIQGNNTSVGGKDFSPYIALIITAKQGVASMTSIMDLTTINTQSNTYNSGALGAEDSDVDYCKFTVNASKTEFIVNRLGYRTMAGQAYDVNTSSAVCMKIVGVLKTPSMIYTGDELTAGNGISIENGVISSNLNWINKIQTLTTSTSATTIDLNGYLPSVTANEEYEVLLTASINNQTPTTGVNSTADIYSDIIGNSSNKLTIVSASSQSSNRYYASGNITLPAKRYLYSSGYAIDGLTLIAFGYRRIK